MNHSLTQVVFALKSSGALQGKVAELSREERCCEGNFAASDATQLGKALYSSSRRRLL